MKDYYSAPKGYLINPFDFLFQNNDVPRSKNPAIQETIQSVIDLDEERLDLDLPYLEHLIQLDSLAYVRKGCVNATIKFKRLYKHTYSNFEQYCKHELGKCVDAVDNSIDAARVCLELIMAGYEYEELPTNMSQACALKKFTGQELIDQWEYVLANLERHQRTANSIKQLLFPPPVSEKTINTTIKLPVHTYSKLLEVAYHANLSISRTLDSVLFLLTEKLKKSDIFKVCNWILDMVDLTNKSNADIIIQ